MNEPMVSVVMPVYNAGGWLRGAIDSVRSQTYRDFELLLVDDGATDGSGQVCDEYAARDGRIRVFHRRNSGICATRNFGLAEARGRYVCFCDHDDLYEPHYLELAVGAALKSGCRIVKCDHTTETRSSDDVRHVVYAGAGVLMKEGKVAVDELRTYAGRLKFKKIRAVIWDGLFARDLFAEDGLRFDEMFRFGGEDWMLLLHALSVTDGVYWIPQVLYRHFENIGVSTSSGFHPELVEDYMTVARVERTLFPCGMRLALWRFWQWYAALEKFVFSKAGGSLKFGERAQIVGSFYRTIVGGLPCDEKMPAKSRLTIFLLGGGHERIYLFLKELGYGAREPVRRKRRIAAEKTGIGTGKGGSRDE